MIDVYIAAQNGGRAEGVGWRGWVGRRGGVKGVNCVGCSGCVISECISGAGVGGGDGDGR